MINYHTTLCRCVCVCSCGPVCGCVLTCRIVNDVPVRNNDESGDKWYVRQVHREMLSLSASWTVMGEATESSAGVRNAHTHASDEYKEKSIKFEVIHLWHCVCSALDVFLSSLQRAIFALWLVHIIICQMCTGFIRLDLWTSLIYVFVNCVCEIQLRENAVNALCACYERVLPGKESHFSRLPAQTEHVH